MLGHSSNCRGFCSWKECILPLGWLLLRSLSIFSGIRKMILFLNRFVQKSNTNHTPSLPLQLWSRPHYRLSTFLGEMSTISGPLLFSLITSGSFFFWNSNIYNVNINKKACIQITYFQWCEHKYILVHLPNRDLSQGIHVSDCKSQRISSKHLK